MGPFCSRQAELNRTGEQQGSSFLMGVRVFSTRVFWGQVREGFDSGVLGVFDSGGPRSRLTRRDSCVLFPTSLTLGTLPLEVSERQITAPIKKLA